MGLPAKHPHCIDVRDLVRLPWRPKMTSYTATQARANLYKLLQHTANSHTPVQINGKKASGVLVSEEDWRAIVETLYLVSIPGMRESIRAGLKTPVDHCAQSPGW